MNREAWLTELAKRVEPLFRGFAFKPYRVTCGWPCRSALSGRNRRTGECHYPQVGRDGFHEIFISPTLEEAAEVAGTLTHELAHVIAGHEAAHGKGFVRVCRHVGLTKGKPQCVQPGEQLASELERMTTAVGKYPHVAIKPQAKPKKPPSSIGLVCPECECKITMGKTALDEFGAPTCACGTMFTTKGG